MTLTHAHTRKDFLILIMMGILSFAPTPTASAKETYRPTPANLAEKMVLDGNVAVNDPNVAKTDPSTPAERKPAVDLDRVRLCDPPTLRAMIGDGNYAGYHQRPDADTDVITNRVVFRKR